MDIVKYHNHINKVNFSGYTEKELNLFFTLIFLAKEKEIKKIVIPFTKLKELSNGDTHSQRFIETLKNVNKKLIKLNHEIEVDNKIHIFSLFNVFTIDKEKKELLVQINEMFSYMLNDLIGNFTKFDLLEFVNLKSSYSKNMFKLLKQWDSLKKKEFDLDELKNILGVPKLYTTSKFNEKVLGPIMTELPAFFHNLNLEKIKTGKKVTSLKFTWENKKQIINSKNDITIEITEELNHSFEKAKCNRFLVGILTNNNIYKLTQMYDENQLKKGLQFIYKNVKKEIPNFTYLIKILETGIQNQNVNIKVHLDDEKEIENNNIQEINLQNRLIQIFEGLPLLIKNQILETAKKMYMEDVKIDKMNSSHDKFFKVAQKQYIFKILNLENKTEKKC
ncbi:MAG: replication initiation protein [Cetobacterium sp.]